MLSLMGVSAPVASSVFGAVILAQATVATYSATLEKFSTHSAAIVSDFQTFSNAKMLAFDASILDGIETILKPLLTAQFSTQLEVVHSLIDTKAASTLDTMLDAKLSDHLLRVDDRLAATIVNSRSKPRSDVPGREDLGNVGGAEDNVLGNGDAVSNADVV